MALEFAEHRVVAAVIHTDEGIDGPRLHAGLRRRRRRVDPGLSRDPPQAADPRRGSRCSSSASGSACTAPTAASSARASPPTGSPRSTSASGTSSARRRGLPLYKLWGAVTDRVPAYGSGGWGHYATEDVIGEAQRYAAPRLPLLQDEDPPSGPAREPPARGGREEGARRRRAPDGRRQPAARRPRQYPPGPAPRGPRPRLVRGAGARRRHRRLRRGGARDQDPRRHRREQLLALRVPRADRAARRPLPDARRRAAPTASARR